MTTSSTGLRSEVSSSSSESSPSLVGTDNAVRLRWLGLLLVLTVSFGQSIVVSLYYSLGGTASTSPAHGVRLCLALLNEGTSLAVLWYVLSGQSRSWKDIGWSVHWTDIPPTFGLLVISTIATYGAVLPVQLLYRAYTGHYLTPKPLQAMLGFGISVLSVAFVCLNPFFEELIVRAYTMSEIMNFSGSRTLAILVSVVIQMSYHTYQGFLSGVGLTATFLVFSIYFSRTRRIGPVVLAHLCLDGYALIMGGF